MVELDSQQMKV